ncbi:hypothetical protein HYH03_001155 [Edaphochlamys debaryana]|uniref:Uncharacterized protein n=1 Tax=Edaphochlamys debaryana TaxID=47281 RepID=A0A835YMT4_9CHLO|nr:hypothetical protein HYH03_001155 [Edaphochlamys debaryana]|eukprot:KAG2501365.1 hypothetical protein HYH03_001155 [Edaphochlamys debaryana]
MASPAAVVLFDPSLLAKILPDVAKKAPFTPHLNGNRGAFRAVSKDARAAFDRAYEAPLVYGPRRYHNYGRPSTSPSQALFWALSMLQRGRRPTAVHIEDCRDNNPAGWQKATLFLLRGIPQLSGSPGRGVACLQLPADLLSPSAAPLIAGAFPNLARLELCRRLTCLELTQQAAQLRDLAFGGDYGGSWDGQPHADTEDIRSALEELASVTQLTALSLNSCAVPLLPILTGALTRLTSLELSGQDDTFSPALFAPLQGLQRLELPRASLGVPGLAEALSSLTRLSVGDFTLPAQELSQPLTSIPRWRLPAGLRELGLDSSHHLPGMPPEVFAGLELPGGLRVSIGASTLVLTPGRHTAAPVEEEGFAGTELLPAAEEALCGALRCVRQHWLPQGGIVRITYKAEAADRHLQPVGGAAGTGPGRPNHGRWLRELGALGPSRLWLSGFQLSYQDVEEMRDSLEELEVLFLGPPCALPLPAMPLLAGLPHLLELHLDATPWAGRSSAASKLRAQALASIVALARAWLQGRHLQLNLLLSGRVSGERVRAMGAGALECMRAAGVRPPYMMVDDEPLEPDSDSEGFDDEPAELYTDDSEASDDEQ